MGGAAISYPFSPLQLPFNSPFFFSPNVTNLPTLSFLCCGCHSHLPFFCPQLQPVLVQCLLFTYYLFIYYLLSFNHLPSFYPQLETIVLHCLFSPYGVRSSFSPFTLSLKRSQTSSYVTLSPTAVLSLPPLSSCPTVTNTPSTPFLPSCLYNNLSIFLFLALLTSYFPPFIPLLLQEDPPASNFFFSAASNPPFYPFIFSLISAAVPSSPPPASFFFRFLSSTSRVSCCQLFFPPLSFPSARRH